MPQSARVECLLRHNTGELFRLRNRRGCDVQRPGSGRRAPPSDPAPDWRCVGDWGHAPSRGDARRNVEALVEAARTVFATSGVDAPAKEITDLADVGVGTLDWYFPQRTDLVKAVVESGIDAVADAGPALSAANPPMAALTEWVRWFTELLATKRGLASALHSGDPAFAGLPGYFLRIDSVPPSPHCSRRRWPTPPSATTSAPKTSCAPSRSCPSPSPD